MRTPATNNFRPGDRVTTTTPLNGRIYGTIREITETSGYLVHWPALEDGNPEAVAEGLDGCGVGWGDQDLRRA